MKLCAFKSELSALDSYADGLQRKPIILESSDQSNTASSSEDVQNLHWALILLTLKEGWNCFVRFSDQGFKIESVSPASHTRDSVAKSHEGQTFESIETLLLSISKAYMQFHSNLLFEKLMFAQQIQSKDSDDDTTDEKLV